MGKIALKMKMKSIDEAAAIATRIALDDSHGYSQDIRYGPDYDCSSLMATALKEAGFDTTFTWTGNMESDLLAHGFKKLAVNTAVCTALKRGDILLYHNSASGNGHTAMYLGDGKIVHATGNENGGIRGGKTGDQTGKEICVANYFNYPWTAVFRYDGEDITDAEPMMQYYTVKAHDTLWNIANKFGTTVDRLCDLNRIENKDLIYIGQVIKIPALVETVQIKADEPVVLETNSNIIAVTIEGANIKNCVCSGNVITIKVGD